MREVSGTGRGRGGGGRDEEAVGGSLTDYTQLGVVGREWDWQNAPAAGSTAGA
jgi:hypothetical protein